MSPRIKAFLIHLGISLLILAALLYVIVFIWYPPPFFAKDGGWQGVRLITGVDLVLGPMLTLAVYNTRKGLRKLKFDLLVIAIIQFSSLAVGCWIVADQRTALVTFSNNRFVSMSQSQVTDSGVTEQVLASLQDQRPPMAYVALPDDQAERARVVMENLGGEPLFKRGDLYEPLTLENRLKIVEQGYDLSLVAKLSDELSKIVGDFFKKSGVTSERVVALPLYCRYGVLSLVLDQENGEIIDTIAINHDQLIASLSKGKQPDPTSSSGN
ncbi:MAG: hypothetical protein WBM41_00940 [Arenicellales bacterium]